jgi:hypothetical protein
MLSHMVVLLTDLYECDQYAQIVFEQARRLAQEQQTQVVVQANSECAMMEEDFAKAAGQYISLILALLGGAGAGAASRREPPP